MALAGRAKRMALAGRAKPIRTPPRSRPSTWRSSRTAWWVAASTHADKEAARTAEAAHRDRRDALITRLAATATPPPAEPAYATPFPVTDRASALRLAVAVEDATAAAWRSVLGAHHAARSASWPSTR